MRRNPSYAQVTSLVARALQLSPDALTAGFRPATQAELPQVLELRQQVFGDRITWDDARYLTWRYRFGSESHGRGEYWVAARGDAVLGILGSEGVNVRHHDFSIPGLSVMDLAVRPDIENIGLGPWMAMTLCRSVPFTVAIGSNPKSRAIVSRILTRLRDRRSYSYYTVLGRRLQQRLRSRWAAETVALLAQGAMKSWRAFSIPTGSDVIRISRLERFDESVDALIERARDPAAVALDKSRAFLNWRLFENPRASYSVWGAYDGELLVAYLAVHAVVNASGRELVIEDWLADPSTNGGIAFRILIGAAIDMAIKEGCENVTVIACHEPSELVLRTIGFRERHNDYETLSVYSNDERLSEAIAAQTPWNVSGSHTDRDV